jgi:hypothetical protein
MPPSRLITGVDLGNGAPYSALAWGDGTHDDQPVLQAAWSACGLIRVPAGNYLIDSPLVGPNVDNAGIIGHGAGLKVSSSSACAGTIISANFAAGDAIQSHASIQHPTFQGLVITRVPPAVAGFGLNLNTICDFALLSDLWITKHAVGLNLSTTGYSKAEFIRSEANTNNGVNIVGQWQLDRIFSVNNGGVGFAVQAVLPGGNSLGQWKGLSTFGNGSYGIAFFGSASAPTLCVRLSDSFFGGDGNHEVYVDSYSTGGQSVFTNVFVEAARSSGFVFTENAGYLSLINCTASRNSEHGLISSAPFISVQGGGFYGHASGCGILVLAGKASICGVQCSGNNIGLKAGSACTDLSYVGNYLSDNEIPAEVSEATRLQVSANI